MSGLGPHEMRAARLQRFKVCLYGGAAPHARIHGGRKQHRLARGAERGGKQIIGNAAGVLAHAVRRRRRNQNQIRPLCQRHMADLVFAVKGIGVGWMPAQRFKAER